MAISCSNRQLKERMACVCVLRVACRCCRPPGSARVCACRQECSGERAWGQAECVQLFSTFCLFCWQPAPSLVLAAGGVRPLHSSSDYTSAQVVAATAERQRARLLGVPSCRGCPAGGRPAQLRRCCLPALPCAPRIPSPPPQWLPPRRASTCSRAGGAKLSASHAKAWPGDGAAQRCAQPGSPVPPAHTHARHPTCQRKPAGAASSSRADSAWLRLDRNAPGLHA